MQRESTIREKMIEVRLQAGLSQSELARRMRTGQSTIAKWETGARYPSLTTLEMLAEVTGRKLEIRFS